MRAKLTNGKGDVLMVDYSKTNVHVNDSYVISKADIADWVNIIKSFGKLYGYTYARSNASWIREWKAHNLLYKWNIEPNRTKDVDLDEGETLFRRICYFLLSIL